MNLNLNFEFWILSNATCKREHNTHNSNRYRRHLSVDWFLAFGLFFYLKQQPVLSSPNRVTSTTSVKRYLKPIHKCMTGTHNFYARCFVLVNQPYTIAKLYIQKNISNSKDERETYTHTCMQTLHVCVYMHDAINSSKWYSHRLLFRLLSLRMRA